MQSLEGSSKQFGCGTIGGFCDVPHDSVGGTFHAFMIKSKDQII